MMIQETGEQQQRTRAETSSDQQVMLYWGLSRLDWLDMSQERRERFRSRMEAGG